MRHITSGFGWEQELLTAEFAGDEWVGKTLLVTPMVNSAGNGNGPYRQ
jgi:hypothetical protein